MGEKLKDKLLGIGLRLKYDDVGPCLEGLRRVRDKKTRLFGYTDRYGYEVISCKYDYANFFKKGSYAEVCKDGKWGVINNRGVEIIPCKFEDCDISNFNYFIVMKDNKWGVVDIKGNEVIPCECQCIIKTGEAHFIVMKKGKYGVVDIKGNKVIPCNYKYVYDYAAGLAKVLKEDKLLWIDTAEVVHAEAPAEKSIFNSAEEVEEYYDALAQAETVAVNFRISHAKNPENIDHAVSHYEFIMKDIISNKAEELSKFADVQKSKQDALNVIDNIMSEYNKISKVDGGMNV